MKIAKVILNIVLVQATVWNLLVTSRKNIQQANWRMETSMDHRLLVILFPQWTIHWISEKWCTLSVVEASEAISIASLENNTDNNYPN